MITLRAATDNSRGSLVVMPAIVMTVDTQRQPTDTQHQPTDTQHQPTDGMTLSPGAEQAAVTVPTTIAGS